jgi:hypothetical protein
MTKGLDKITVKHDQRSGASSIIAVDFVRTRDFMAVQVLPRDAGEREKLGCQIDDYLQNLLSDPTRWLFNPQHRVHGSPILIIDWLILGLASYLGARLYLSPMVQNRLLQWEDEPCGPELLAEFGKRLVRRAKKNQGKGTVPVEPWHYEFKEHIVRELTALQRLLRARGLKPGELKREITEQVQCIDSPFPLLLSNWTSFGKFLDLEESMFKAFSVGQTTPTLVAGLWMAKAFGNRDPESTRQAVSKAGRAVRASKVRL